MEKNKIKNKKFAVVFLSSFSLAADNFRQILNHVLIGLYIIYQCLLSTKQKGLGSDFFELSLKSVKSCYGNIQNVMKEDIPWLKCFNNV